MKTISGHAHLLTMLYEAKYAFRAYVNAAGVKKKFTGKQLVIARNTFPGVILPAALLEDVVGNHQ